MKKKEQTKQKQKEFAAAPFKALKGIQLSTPAVPTPPAARQPVPQKKAEKAREAVADESLFFDAMADVQPLHRGAPPAPRKAEAERRERGVGSEDQREFLKAVEALRMEVRFSDAAEEEIPVRPVPVNRLRQLRRGTIRVDLQLDLHGLTRDEALENLAPFIQHAHARGQKGVLVITGKGNNSNGEPVLRQAVASWLREQGKGMVAEFAPAPKDMGGSGAFVVFLKEKKPEGKPQG